MVRIGGLAPIPATAGHQSGMSQTGNAPPVTGVRGSWTSRKDGDFSTNCQYESTMKKNHRLLATTLLAFFSHGAFAAAGVPCTVTGQAVIQSIDSVDSSGNITVTAAYVQVKLPPSLTTYKGGIKTVASGELLTWSAGAQDADGICVATDPVISPYQAPQPSNSNSNRPPRKHGEVG
jgi:hypothetical protein